MKNKERPIRRAATITQLIIVVVMVVALSACGTPLSSGDSIFGESAALGNNTPSFLNSDPSFNTDLNASIQKYIDSLPGGTTASVGYQKLDGSDTQHIVGSTGEMKTASVIKLWVAAAALQAGTATDHQLEQMISYSHNLTTNDLAYSVGGLDALNKTIKNAGYPNTRMEREMGSSTKGKDFWTTSADTLSFLNRLYRGDVNGVALDAVLLGYMKNQKSYAHDNGSDGAPNLDANKIRQAIESRPEFKMLANKTGENTGAVANDVAIVYTKKGDFLLTIFTMNGDNAANVEFNRLVAALVYDAMLDLDVSNDEPRFESDGEQTYDLNYDPNAEQRYSQDDTTAVDSAHDPSLVAHDEQVYDLYYDPDDEQIYGSDDKSMSTLDPAPDHTSNKQDTATIEGG